MIYHTGMLDQRVSLQRRTIVDDGSGGGVETWAQYAEVWAHVRPMSGREREIAQRMEAAANYLVVVRMRSDVLANDKIVWSARELNVRFVKDKGPRDGFLEIEAELGTGS
jgi:SPP1 family predicted phage head-tail adaptor